MATASEDEAPSGSYFSAPSATSQATSRADGFDSAPISKEAQDDGLARKLWERTEKLVASL